MKKQKNKYIILIFAILVSIIVFPKIVFADVIPGGLESYANQPTVAESASFLEMAGKVLGVIFVIGIIISVAAIIIIGIKFITGSIEQKAEYKKMLLPYLIGFILLVGIRVFVTIIGNISGNF